MLGLLLALAAQAAPAGGSELPGVWEGTIGTLPVRVCFVRNEEETFGAYYYLSRLQLIPLEWEDGTRGAFLEGGDSEGSQPRWLVDRAAAGQLTGRWSSGRRTLPLRLRRIARPAPDEGACGTLAFHQPRLAGVRIATSRAAKDGVAYTRRVLDTGDRFDIAVETFALDGSGPAVQRINAELGRDLAGNPPRWFECIHDSLEFHSIEGASSETIAPAMISRRWLSVTDHWDGDCGGAHPESSDVYRTFDLTSGREVDLFDWLKPTAVTRPEGSDGTDNVRILRPDFRTYILSGWHADDSECNEVVGTEDYWNIGLTRDGLVFTPLLAHVVESCREPITVPFARLGPYLTPEAAANIRALQAEGRPAA